MSDMLIRDIPDAVLAAIDAPAARLGVSRSEYIRGRLAQDGSVIGLPVSVEDLRGFAAVFADLANPPVIARARE